MSARLGLPAGGFNLPHGVTESDIDRPYECAECGRRSWDDEDFDFSDDMNTLCVACAERKGEVVA